MPRHTVNAPIAHVTLKPSWAEHNKNYMLISARMYRYLFDQGRRYGIAGFNVPLDAL